MHRVLFFFGLYLAASATGRSAPLEVFPGLGRNWRYYQSENFELYSANNERDSRDVLEKMELVSAVITQEFQLRVRIPRRVTIYYFNDEQEFMAYTPPRTNEADRFAGYSFSSADGMILTMAPASGRRWARELAYRQCVRFIFQRADRYPPDWFLLGLGEIMATMKEEGDRIVLGAAVAGRAELLQKWGLEQVWPIMARDSDEVARMQVGQRRLYDGECWALLHYCMFAKEGFPPMQRAQLLRVAESELSRNRPRWFERYVAATLAPGHADLTAELQGYVKARKFKTRSVVRPEVEVGAGYKQRPVGVEEMSAQLAELGFRAKQAPYGTYKIQEMFSKDPSLRLQELIGAVAQQEGNLPRVRDCWGAAVGLGTTNVGVLNEFCRIEGDNVFTELNLDFRLPQKRAEYLRALALKSISVAPAQSTAYEMLAWIEAYAAAPVQGNVDLVGKRLEQLNNPASVRLALALVRFRQRDDAGALELLNQLGGEENTTWTAARAEILRATIEKRPVNLEVVRRQANRT